MKKIKVTRMNTKTGETFTRWATEEQYNNIKISQGLYIIVPNPVDTLDSFNKLLKSEKYHLNRYKEDGILSATYIYKTFEDMIKVLKTLKQGKKAKQMYYTLYQLQEKYLKYV